MDGDEQVCMNTSSWILWMLWETSSKISLSWFLCGMYFLDLRGIFCAVYSLHLSYKSLTLQYLKIFSNTANLRFAQWSGKISCKSQSNKWDTSLRRLLVQDTKKITDNLTKYYVKNTCIVFCCNTILNPLRTYIQV